VDWRELFDAVHVDDDQTVDNHVDTVGAISFEIPVLERNWHFDDNFSSGFFQALRQAGKLDGVQKSRPELTVNFDGFANDRVRRGVDSSQVGHPTPIGKPRAGARI
jgi:hypothetical protein